MSSKVENLQKRLNELAEKQPLHAEPRPWFGFRSAYPIHSYDPPDANFDITNMNAWEWFCYLQWTATEIDEYIAISVWNDVNRHPLVVYGTPPDLQAEAEAHHNRKQELEIVAQARAEQVDQQDPDAWIRWKEFYKQLERQNEDQDQEASDEPEPTERADDSPGKGIHLLWTYQLKVLEIYRKWEKE